MGHSIYIRCFLERFFARNKSHAVVQSLLAPFWHFKSLTQTGHFAKAIVFASWPILAIFKKALIFRILGISI